MYAVYIARSEQLDPFLLFTINILVGSPLQSATDILVVTLSVTGVVVTVIVITVLVGALIMAKKRRRARQGDVQMEELKVSFD